MKWINALNQKLLKPKVVHRLRGRIRLELPLLKHLPAHFLPDAERLEKLTHLFSGLQSISLSSQTMLVTYDHETLKEADILGALESISGFIIDQKSFFEKMTDQECLNFLEKLEKYCMQHGVQSLIVNHKITIPYEIDPTK